MPVLFEDDTLFALDKPSGLLSSPDRYDPARPNLMRLLHRDIERGAPWAAERNITYLANAHRLDFQTSGVMLMAKNKPALVKLANEFGSGKPRKSYLAVVKGTPEEDEFELDAKIAPHPVQIGVMRVDHKRGKKATTRFQVVDKFAGYTLLRCFPVTGRTHQIRVHLHYLHLPIIGDKLYAGEPLMLSDLKRGYQLKKDKVENPLLGRVALHAESLAIEHPATGAEVEIHSPMPHDFEVALKYLRRFASVGGVTSPAFTEPAHSEED